MRESDALSVIDRVGTEIRVAWRTGQVQEVITRTENVFVQIVDESNVTQG